jgi:hypothetical protein
LAWSVGGPGQRCCLPPEPPSVSQKARVWDVPV